MEIYDQSQVEEVVKSFQEHKVLAFPTDTVYGVGVLYGDLDDLEKLKNAKHRPETKPIPMMVSSIEQMEKVAVINERTKKLVKAFMPGAITLILPSLVDSKYTNGKDTIAIRMPADDFVLSVIQKLDTPLLVTSANQSGAPTAMTYDDALLQLPNIDGIVKGECKALWASTIVDCTKEELKVLRQGPISYRRILEAIS